jgi:uncharacterized protein (DUF1330 family)
MSAYAVAIVRETRFGPEVKEYLEKIDETLRPYPGTFRVHSGPYHLLEGASSGDLIIIEFPSLAQAKAWYSSAAYQAIKPLRTSNTDGDVFLVTGVSDSHTATDILG